MPGQPRQINIRVRPGLHRTLESIARAEQRTVSQIARLLIEEGLEARGGGARDDVPPGEVAVLAAKGAAFDWLEDEPELYDDHSGEPA